MAKVSELSALLVPCLLFACAGGAQPGGGGVQQATLGEDVTLAVGQRVQVDGGAREVRFDGVPHDSRCPVDVQCITAGNAVARLRLACAGGDAQTVELNTTVGPKEATHAGYTVRLVTLRPEQTSGLRITPGEYRAVLQATQG